MGDNNATLLDALAACAEVRYQNATYALQSAALSTAVGLDDDYCAPWWSVGVVVLLVSLAVCGLICCCCCCCRKGGAADGLSSVHRPHASRRHDKHVRFNDEGGIQQHRSLPPAPSKIDLPDGWEMVLTDDQPYFFNKVTGESQWEAPPVAGL